MRLIRKIERETDSRLVVYITGDRPGQETKIAGDIFPFCHQHLQRAGRQESISLLLYTRGGLTMAGFGIVNLFREFCNNFNVMIPFRAHSCGTLISLGANEILMTKMGQLSPIDPSVDHPLGPQVQIPGAPPGVTQRVPINVEDAVSFLKFAKEEAGLKQEDSLASVFGQLSSDVNPLALGAVNRSREQIGFLAKTLLSRHMNEEERINSIVKVLSRERFSHSYIIGRREAKESLKLPIADISSTMEELLLKLYSKYSDLLELTVPYNPEIYLGQQSTVTFDLNRGILESHGLTHVFRSRLRVSRVQVTREGVQQTLHHSVKLFEAWVQDNTL